nr:MAG TPA: tail protein [Caudoviricetes sp.]
MILYFADRKMNIIGQASTELPQGLTVCEDLKTEDTETGVAIFECKLPFDEKTRSDVEQCAEVGNYILRSHDAENEFYTIIETEIDTKNQEVSVYAEDAGLDLLNEICGEYVADKAYNIAFYINKFAKDTGFEIGINEAKSLTRKLSWDGEATATERIASVATQFGDFEISYSFKIDGLIVTRKYINIYKKRGSDKGVQLRLNKEIDSIVITKSIANLATALKCEGGTPDDAEKPITLKGYTYDDGDIYIGSDGVMRSRTACNKWSRYVWNLEPNQLDGYKGNIIRTYSYDTTSQKELCNRAITELKKIREIEVNYEIDISKLPEDVKIGDRVNIIDEAGELFLSTRILKLETSVCDGTQNATLGEYLIKGSGISQKVLDLAADFTKTSQSAARALTVATAAKTQAEDAQSAADAADEKASEAQNTAYDVAKVASGAESGVQQLADQIPTLITDGNGTSLMTKAESGWTFNLNSVTKTLDGAVTDIDALKGDTSDMETAISRLQGSVADLGELAEYIIVTSYNGQPCIELGKIGSDFKLRITNTEIQFLEGSTMPAYINNQALNISTANIEDELQFGGFAFKKRANGNMGLVWKGDE